MKNWNTQHKNEFKNSNLSTSLYGRGSILEKGDPTPWEISRGLEETPLRRKTKIY